MIDMTKTPEELAIAKLQEIIEKAVDSEADSITIEYAKEGGLEVCFIFGVTGVGSVLVDRTLEGEVMNLIHEGVGLEEKPSGLLHWTAYGKHLDIRVEEYDSFGETAYTLRLPKIKKGGT
jgi:hypothetical protein